MIDLLPYLIKSSLGIAILYLLFRLTLRNDSFFSLNRILILSIVLFSIAMPFLYFPWPVENVIEVKVFPSETPIQVPEINDTAIQITTTHYNYPVESNETSISYQQAFTIIYLLGCIVSLCILLIGFSKIIFHLFQAKIYKKKNYKIALVNAAVAPMSFGRYIIISKKDYRENRTEIIEHELAHINYKHTIDLLLLEFIKIVHWFNPMVYALIRDLKQIQEFQVDRKVINSGIDSKAYQLLMIKKCVGTERYALANSFNHCQIKNRIVMMNNQKTNKSKSWKVAIFLPVAALMLMAFGSKRSDVPIENSIVEQSISNQQQKVWKESDFKKLNLAEIRQKGKNNISHWILINDRSQIMFDGKVISFSEVKQTVQQLFSKSESEFNKKASIEDEPIVDLIFYVKKHNNADETQYNQLVSMIANSFIDTRDKLSLLKYNKNYNNLDSQNKFVIETMVPINLFQYEGKYPPPPPSTPPPPPSTLTIKKEGLYLGRKLYTEEELTKLIDFNNSDNSDNSKMRFIIKVETGVADDKIREAEKILKNATIIRFEQVKPVPRNPSPFNSIKAIDIEADNETIKLNNKPVLLENLAAEINKLYPDENRVLTASLEVSESTEMGTVTAIKEVLRKAKVLNINYSSSNKGSKDTGKLNHKIINITIGKTTLTLNTYPVTIDQLIPRIKKLSKGFEGCNITVSSFTNSIVQKNQLLQLLEKEKETLRIKNDVLWIVNDMPAYPTKTKVLYLEIDGTEILMNDKPVLLENLAAEIKKQYPEINPELIASVKVNGGSTKKETTDAIKEILRNAKIENINYSTETKGNKQ